jgi:hypothetical protein
MELLSLGLLIAGAILWAFVFRYVRYLLTFYGGKYLIAQVACAFLYAAVSSGSFMDELSNYFLTTFFFWLIYVGIKVVIAIKNSEAFASMKEGYNKGKDLANYQIGGSRKATKPSTTATVKSVFGGAPPPKPKEPKRESPVKKEVVAEEKSEPKTTTPYSGSMKTCATCSLWGGERELDAGRIVVRTAAANVKGKCMGGGHNHQLVPASGTCSAHAKWSALK